MRNKKIEKKKVRNMKNVRRRDKRIPEKKRSLCDFFVRLCVYKEKTKGFHSSSIKEALRLWKRGSFSIGD